MTFFINNQKDRRNKHLKETLSPLSVLAISFLCLPVVAYAQAPFVMCSGLNCGLWDLLLAAVRIYNWLLGMAGIVFLGVVVWGGIKMMLFYLSELPEAELKNAKYTITRGIVGLFIIGASYLIVYTLLYGIFAVQQQSWLSRLLGEFNLDRFF